MTKAIGIDVAKAHLDVAVSDRDAVIGFDNSPAGWAELVAWTQHIAPEQVVLEATGGYERGVLSALAEAGLPVARVNPRQARDFAKATGELAKTDALDAHVLARMGALLELPRYQSPGVTQDQLQALVARRSALVQMRTAERNRRDQTDPAVRLSIDAVLATLGQQITAVERQVQALLARATHLADKARQLQQIPGIATTGAASLLGTIPELGRLDRKAIAKLIGVAPLNRDSGTQRGTRTTWGGRAPARTALYMATLVAVQHEPSLKARYQHLKAGGKPPKVALVACMRTLLIRINAMLRDGTAWQTEPVPQS